jgi:hypothetical protein
VSKRKPEVWRVVKVDDSGKMVRVTVEGVNVTHQQLHFVVLVQAPYYVQEDEDFEHKMIVAAVREVQRECGSYAV